MIELIVCFIALNVTSALALEAPTTNARSMMGRDGSANNKRHLASSVQIFLFVKKT